MARALALVPLLLVLLHGCGRAPPARRKEKPVANLAAAPAEAAYALPPRVVGGAPDPPQILPPARGCRDALAADGEVDSLPGQVNGALLKGAPALLRLRARWGDALVVVRGGNFERADLRGARLHNFCFIDTKFAGSDWRGARAAGIGFLWSDLTGARLSKASMPRVLFDGPYLERVDASGADLSGGLITGNDFGGWDGLRLDGAVLRGFRFDCTPVTGSQCAAHWGKVSFRRADLRGAWIDGFWGEADWTAARFENTRVNVRKLPELGRARLTGSLVVYERPSAVRLSASEYRWLGRHIAGRRDSLPVESEGRKVTKPPSWLRPGADVLFVAPRIDFDPVARRTPVFRRLLPAIVAGAISYARVKVDRRGRVSASGSAVGGNQHMCGLGAANLRFGRRGWYSGVASAGDLAVKPTGIPVPVIRFWADRAEVYERGHSWDEAILRNGFDAFVMCGARAGFEEMIRVPFPSRGAHRLWYEAGMDGDRDEED